MVGSVVGVDPDGWFPFSVVKWWLLVAGGALALASVLAQRCVRAERSVVVAWGVTLLVVVAAASTAPGLRPWVGSAERHFGVLAFVVFFAWWLVGRSIAVDHDALELLRRWCVVAGAAMSLWAALELAGLEPVAVASGSDRLTGPYGSAAYTGAGAILLLGPALQGVRRGGRDAVAGALVAFGLVVTIIATQSRSAIVGLAFVVVVAAVCRESRSRVTGHVEF